VVRCGGMWCQGGGVRCLIGLRVPSWMQRHGAAAKHRRSAPECTGGVMRRLLEPMPAASSLARRWRPIGVAGPAKPYVYLGHTCVCITVNSMVHYTIDALRDKLLRLSSFRSPLCSLNAGSPCGPCSFLCNNTHQCAALERQILPTVLPVCCSGSLSLNCHCLLCHGS
jgi:hypothetical protein